MATCPFCSQPLGGDDRFCTGCGKSVSASGPAAAAAAVGAAVGAAPASSSPTGFRWKWALLTIPIAVGTVFVSGFVMGIMHIGPEGGSLPEPVVTLAVLGSMVVAGLIVGWFSPGRTVYEPGVGLAAAVVALNVFGGNVQGVVVGWLLPFALGAGGAWLGEWLQGQCESR